MTEITPLSALREHRRTLVVIIAVALLLRVVVVVATRDYKPVDDAWDYNRHAVSIADGHGYPRSGAPGGGPSAYRPPVYPFFLGAVFKVTGDSVNQARLVQAVLSVATVALIWVLAMQLAGPREAG